MEYIDSIYFINLDHRTDRLEQFQEEMKRMGFPQEKITRIEAVSTPNIGVLGCAYSHIKTITSFLESSSKYCMIFEDDFLFTVDKHYCSFLLKHLFKTNSTFDIVMMGGKIMKEESISNPFLYRVLDAQTTSGYILSRKFASILKQNLEEGVSFLEKWYAEHKSPKHEYCLDIYWKGLQPESEWFVFHPKLGIQRESYSDIEKKISNYGV